MEFYKLKLPDNGKEISIKDWTFKDEYDLQKRIANNNDPFEETNICLDFIKEHVKEKDLFDSLSDVDIYKILFILRNNSKGNIIEYKFKCLNDKVKKDDELKKCTAYGQYQDSSIDIINDVKYNVRTIKKLELDDMIINFKCLSFRKMIDIIKNVDEINKLKYNIILNCIDSVIIDGNIKNFNTIDEVNDFIENCKPKYVYSILDNYKKILSNMEITKKNICPVCKKETILKINDFSFFL